MTHVSENELTALLRAINTYPTLDSRIGLQLLAMFFCRATELREAKWAESDLESALWTIPDFRMKNAMSTQYHGPKRQLLLESFKGLRFTHLKAEASSHQMDFYMNKIDVYGMEKEAYWDSHRSLRKLSLDIEMNADLNRMG